MIKGAITEIVANGMARTTVGSRSWMRSRGLRLSYRSNRSIFRTAIVARSTIIDDVGVGKNRGSKCCNRVTQVTVLVSRQMVCCLDNVWSSVSSW